MLTARAIHPVLATAVLRVDGVPHAPGEAAVLEPARRDAFRGTLPWSLELWGPAARLLPRIPGLASGRPSRTLAMALLRWLRPLLLRAGDARPQFALCTVDYVDVGPARLRLAGTCAPMPTEATRYAAPAV